MDEGFDVSIDTGVDSSMSSMDVNIEPLDNIPVEESISMDSLNELVSPVSEQELTELQNEAEALSIQPLDDVVECNANQENNEIIEKPNDASTIETAAIAAMSNVDSPSIGARGIAAGLNMLTSGHLGDPSANAAAVRLAQMGIDVAPVVMQGMTEEMIRQHGGSISVENNQELISQAIVDGARSAGSTGLELTENEPLYDENGVDLTNENLRE